MFSGFSGRKMRDTSPSAAFRSHNMQHDSTISPADVMAHPHSQPQMNQFAEFHSGMDEATSGGTQVDSVTRNPPLHSEHSLLQQSFMQQSLQRDHLHQQQLEQDLEQKRRQSQHMQKMLDQPGNWSNSREENFIVGSTNTMARFAPESQQPNNANTSFNYAHIPRSVNEIGMNRQGSTESSTSRTSTLPPGSSVQQSPALQSRPDSTPYESLNNITHLTLAAESAGGAESVWSPSRSRPISMISKQARQQVRSRRQSSSQQTRPGFGHLRQNSGHLSQASVQPPLFAPKSSEQRMSQHLTRNNYPQWPHHSITSAPQNPLASSAPSQFSTMKRPTSPDIPIASTETYAEPASKRRANNQSRRYGSDNQAIVFNQPNQPPSTSYLSSPTLGPVEQQWPAFLTGDFGSDGDFGSMAPLSSSSPKDFPPSSHAELLADPFQHSHIPGQRTSNNWLDDSIFSVDMSPADHTFYSRPSTQMDQACMQGGKAVAAFSQRQSQVQQSGKQPVRVRGRPRKASEHQQQNEGRSRDQEANDAHDDLRDVDMGEDDSGGLDSRKQVSGSGGRPSNEFHESEDESSSDKDDDDEDAKAKKRVSHKIIEQNRRDRNKNEIEYLKELVPAYRIKTARDTAKPASAKMGFISNQWTFNNRNAIKAGKTRRKRKSSQSEPPGRRPGWIEHLDTGLYGKASRQRADGSHEVREDAVDIIDKCDAGKFDYNIKPSNVGTNDVIGATRKWMQDTLWFMDRMFLREAYKDAKHAYEHRINSKKSQPSDGMKTVEMRKLASTLRRSNTEPATNESALLKQAWHYLNEEHEDMLRYECEYAQMRKFNPRFWNRNSTEEDEDVLRGFIEGDKPTTLFEEQPPSNATERKKWEKERAKRQKEIDFDTPIPPMRLTLNARYSRPDIPGIDYDDA